MSSSYYRDFHYPIGVNVLPDYELLLTFDNGDVRKFDVKPYLEDEFWKPLRDPSLFDSAYINGSVCWSDSLDIAPEELWHSSVPVG
jgi:hypothetical protein